jgi:hypothetical protein
MKEKTEKAYRTVGLAIKLGEPGEGFEEVPQRVQLMRTCSFFHDRYGKVDITRRMFDEMKANFEANVRGIQLMIDYAHDSEREAAGWIKGLEIVQNLELGEDQLWAIVDWTPAGRRTLADKEFAYLSADFDPSYKDNENPTKIFGTVLLGAGLTNRPVIKKMNPAIQLSEYSQTNNKESKMTEEQVKAAEAQLAQVNKLMEDLGVASIEDLMKMIGEMKTSNESMMGEKIEAQKEIALSELFSKGKITKAQKDAAKALNGEVFAGFIKLAELNEGIKTNEVGDTGNKDGGSSETTDPEDKLIELSEAMAKEKKIDITSAIKIVLSENTDLKKAYYKKVGTYNGEEE